MPKDFDDMLDAIKAELKGKINPKTSKPYTEADLYSIAVAAYKKKHGGNIPTAGEKKEVVVAENVKIRFNSYLEVTE